jgi:hypothetical protein
MPVALRCGRDGIRSTCGQFGETPGSMTETCRLRGGGRRDAGESLSMNGGNERNQEYRERAVVVACDVQCKRKCR